MTDIASAAGFCSSEIETQILLSQTASEFSHSLAPEPTLDFEFLSDEVVRSNALAFAGFCRGEHRFRDRPEMLDEKLNHRAERPVFPGHDPDRRTSLATARRCKTGMFNARSRMAKLLKEPRSMEFKRMERTSAGSSLALALRARDARIL